MVVDMVAYLGYKVGLVLIYIEYKIKECNVLHIFHVLVWDQKTCDHVVYCTDEKMVIQDTVL